MKNDILNVLKEPSFTEALDSSDKMPEDVFFVLPVAKEVTVNDDGLIQLKVNHYDDYAINAVNASLENESDIFVVPQQGCVACEPQIGKKGFIASIIKQSKLKDGSYTIQIKPKHSAIIKEILRSPSCFAAKVEMVET